MITGSIALLFAALFMLQKGRRRAHSELIAERLQGDISSRSIQKKARKNGLTPSWSLRKFEVFPGWLTGVMAVSAGIVSLTLYGMMGWSGLLASLAALFLVAFALMRWRYRRRLEKMVRQTPVFLDHIMRSLKSGRTLGDAMILAMDQCQNPLREAMAPTRHSIELGLPLGEAIEDFAATYDREEFHILAMGVRVNQRYGGNASDLLSSLVAMIHDRERAARQLRALTGETRISALVLAALPVTLAVYILIANPSFFMGLWHTESGRLLLLSALTLQVVGCVVLWRMLRSV